MDAGIAAILGATVGALGTGGAAFATGWWGAKQARLQIATQETQSRRQLRFNHLSERREPRSVAYVALISQAQAAQRKYSTLAPQVLISQDSATAELADGLETENVKMQELAARVSIEGPASIVEPARKLKEAVGKCSFFCLVMHMENSELKRSGTAPAIAAQNAIELSQMIDLFTHASRLSLDEDISGLHTSESP
ncbi:hypothetical protein ACF08M_36125 [Streptomyces sp. NPDC015032]|uniref:hypothetical protein n=1 Tax=Streptomyces sp. NPDC015032 TaxID=3364937 RepID=UPI00370363D7